MTLKTYKILGKYLRKYLRKLFLSLVLYIHNINIILFSVRNIQRSFPPQMFFIQFITTYKQLCQYCSDHKFYKKVYDFLRRNYNARLTMTLAAWSWKELATMRFDPEKKECINSFHLY